MESDYTKYIDQLLDFINLNIQYRIIDISPGFNFSYKTYTENRKMKEMYILDVELEKSLHELTRLTLRHEIGHIYLHRTWINNPQKALGILSNIKEYKWFVRFQKIWYWNRLIRWIKRKLGFSSKIKYKPKDTAYIKNDLKITHEEDELFADWFTLVGIYGVL